MFHVEFDCGEVQVSVIIIKSLSAILDTRPTNLKPLADTVGPDMLESMVSQSENQNVFVGDISFVYEEFEITIDPDGHVWLERL